MTRLTPRMMLALTLPMICANLQAAGASGDTCDGSVNTQAALERGDVLTLKDAPRVAYEITLEDGRRMRFVIDAVRVLPAGDTVPAASFERSMPVPAWPRHEAESVVSTF